MDLIVSHLKIPIEKDGIDEYENAVSQKLETGQGAISIEKILSKSLDATNKNQFYYTVSVVVRIDDRFENSQNYPVYTEFIKATRKIPTYKDRPIIVGFGPADELHSHTVNDQIALAQLRPAMAFYAMFTEIYQAVAPEGES